MLPLWLIGQTDRAATAKATALKRPLRQCLAPLPTGQVIETEACGGGLARPLYHRLEFGAAIQSRDSLGPWTFFLWQGKQWQRLPLLRFAGRLRFGAIQSCRLQGGNPNAGVNNLQRVGFHGIPTQFKQRQVLSEGDRDRM